MLHEIEVWRAVCAEINYYCEKRAESRRVRGRAGAAGGLHFPPDYRVVDVTINSSDDDDEDERQRLLARRPFLHLSDTSSLPHWIHTPAGRASVEFQHLKTAAAMDKLLAQKKKRKQKRTTTRR